MLFRITTRLLVCLIAWNVLAGCGTAGDSDSNAATADKDLVATDRDIIAANQLVLANESRLSLPAVSDSGQKVRYFLPFEAGRHRGVSQGINGSTSHQGMLAYAIDWNLTGYNDFRLPVLASAPGTVVLAELLERFGNCVVIRHRDGSRTRYAHLDEISVAFGQHVGQAEKIGLVGTTGHSSGPHLHFEIIDVQMAGMMPEFAEQIAVPEGDMPCTTDSEDSGCYESQNVSEESTSRL
jgi:murein DD-endopeptidase MepM/ murein hydrolase activator NlpD